MGAVRDTFRVYYNKLVGDFLDSLPEEERKTAAKTLDFIKENYPECANALNGKLVYEEIHDGNN